MDVKGGEFWSQTAWEVFKGLQGSAGGLSSDEVRRRLGLYGANLLKPSQRSGAPLLLLSQFKSPLILILLAASVLSLCLHDSADALIILAIVLLSGLLGFWQEHGAANAVERLLAIVQIKATVLRDSGPVEVSTEGVVPGDVVLLSAGGVVPGDGLLLESKDLFIDEASLTGETFPVEKATGVLPAGTPLAQRTNALFMGTHVVSGSGRFVVVRTGRDTEFGKVSERLKLRPLETDFEHGVRKFGTMLAELTLILVLCIFAVNVFLQRPVLNSFLFALALAVGLTPQLLPAIISINLAHGARGMARQKVIVKRLNSIENFGSMDVLCSDKTGTLTSGVVELQQAVDVEGRESQKAHLFTCLNACFESGFVNPIDQTIRTHNPFDLGAYRKLDEVPYDFIRKRLSVLVSYQGSALLVTKGALQNVLDICSRAEKADGTVVGIENMRKGLQQRFEALSAEGCRVLAVAYRDLGTATQATKSDEHDLTFLGFLTLSDRPKLGIEKTIRELSGLGVALKIITGDNRLVAAQVGRQVGLAQARLLNGPELRQLSDEALLRRVGAVDIFAEVEPNQKERIILALRKAGHVVGYIGDGINDASALHAADVGLSVNNAVDVAKEAADIVLLENDLGVLIRGVREGRRTFANTLKYVFMATSANFGNMFSMAVASLFLPFLPMLPVQILLTNLLTDFPEMTIATDHVDREQYERPRRWDIKFIRNYMLTFGPLSSVFDFLTFGVLLLFLHATPELFRTGWFLESVVSSSIIVLVIRSRRLFFRSRPGKYLVAATLVIVGVTIVLAMSPLGSPFEFLPLPPWFLLVLTGVVVLYMAAAELTKRLFYRWVKVS